MTSAATHILITGATGSIGGQLAGRLLKDPKNHLLLLVRDKGRNGAASRTCRALGLGDEHAIPWDRLDIIRGDVSEPRLGLSRDCYLELARKTNLLIHSAATTKLSDSASNCRRINLHGTENILSFATEAMGNGRLERLSHISTAYVAGNSLPYKLMEDNLPEKPDFSNHYESSKHQAEIRVREEMRRGLRVTIFRPSIVVGDSTTGRPASFNVLYPFCRLLASGMLSRVPIHLDSSMNIVPIDFVVQSIAAISQSPLSLGKTYHLVSKKPQLMRGILNLKDYYPELAYIFERFQMVDPATFHPSQLPEEEQLVYQGLAHYLPYLENHLSFDTTNMDAILPHVGLQWPDTGISFLRKLFEYVVAVGYIPTD